MDAIPEGKDMVLLINSANEKTFVEMIGWEGLSLYFDKEPPVGDVHMFARKSK